MATVSFKRSAIAPTLLALLAASCLKPTTAPNQGPDQVSGAGTGNSQPGGGASNGSGGAGGQGAPTGGTGSGTAGSGVVIVDPTGGASAAAGAPMKVACMDSANQQGALPYT